MKRPILLTLILCFFFAGELFCQSPYQLSWSKDAGLLGGGLLTTGLGTYFSINTTPLTTEEIFTVDRESVNGFDRTATFNNSPEAADWSDFFLFGSHTMSALFLLDKRSRSDFGKIALLYGEVYFLTSGLTFISKSKFLRSRPFVYNETFDEGVKLSRNARFSFFSGHASLTAANTFFFAKVFSDYFPDSKLKPFVWGVAAGVPAAVAYFRVAAGKHFPTDVIVGYGVGAAIGYLIPQLHKTYSPNAKLSFYPGVGGGSLVWRFH